MAQHPPGFEFCRGLASHPRSAHAGACSGGRLSTFKACSAQLLEALYALISPAPASLVTWDEARSPTDSGRVTHRVAHGRLSQAGGEPIPGPVRSPRATSGWRPPPRQDPLTDDRWEKEGSQGRVPVPCGGTLTMDSTPSTAFSRGPQHSAQ